MIIYINIEEEKKDEWTTTTDWWMTIKKWSIKRLLKVVEYDDKWKPHIIEEKNKKVEYKKISRK
jgi:hypothetical protein